VRKSRTLLFAALIISSMIFFSTTKAKAPGGPTATLLATGLQQTIGSTVGPDGALYIPEGALGRISRVDPRTGAVTTFASGLPKALLYVGGPIDVAFIDDTAYVLVTLVGPDLGGNDTVGIYRVDGPDQFTVIADIGSWAAANPPNTEWFVPTGVQFALEPYQGGFLVTDGHHNRVIGVTLDGDVFEVEAFDNIVPTGLATWGTTVYMSEAGPVPHNPEDGKVIAFGPKLDPVVVTSGAPLMVGVQFGPGRALYALSQGVWSGIPIPASPAAPNTGSILRVNDDGSLTTIIDHLDRPGSMQFIGNSAFVITLTGEVWRIDGVTK
jgi:hypothetical protein